MISKKKRELEIEMVPIRPNFLNEDEIGYQQAEFNADLPKKLVFANELLDEVTKEPTLDIYLDRSPKLNQQIDYEEMVRILQRKRAAFITAEQKRKEPKIEGED